MHIMTPFDHSIRAVRMKEKWSPFDPFDQFDPFDWLLHTVLYTAWYHLTIWQVCLKWKKMVSIWSIWIVRMPVEYDESIWTVPTIRNRAIPFESNRRYWTCMRFTGTYNSFVSLVCSHVLYHFFKISINIFLQQINFNIFLFSSFWICSGCPCTLMWFSIIEENLILNDTDYHFNGIRIMAMICFKIT